MVLSQNQENENDSYEEYRDPNDAKNPDEQEQYQEDDDLDEIKYQERYTKLLKVFRVLPPDQVDELVKKEEDKAKQKSE